MNKIDQIYETSLKLFNQYGFDKTPTALIAKEAGVAVGTLFHHFKTKEDLINSLYLKCKDNMMQYITSAIEKEGTYRGKLKRIYSNYMAWGKECTEQYNFYRLFSNSVYIKEVTRTEGENKLSSLIDFLKEGIKQEILHKAPIDYLVELSSSMFVVNMNYYLSNSERLEFHTFIDETFEYIWNSIKY